MIKNGTNGNDTLMGTDLSDTIRGLSGDDTIYGKGGPDGLYGGPGNDRIWAGAGVDALFGELGNDKLYGEAGDDWISGGAGNDFLQGGSGDDRLRGDDGDDHLDGSIGNNDLAGGAGNDVLYYTDTALPVPVNSVGFSTFDGGSGIDTLKLDVSGIFDVGGDLHGVLGVFQGADGSGNITYSTDPFEGSEIRVGSFKGIERFELSDDCNRLDFATDAAVTVVGGNGDDVMTGRDNDQTFIGGGGADLFIFRFFDGETNAGDDVINGFSAAEGDRISFNVIADPDGGTNPFNIVQTEANGVTTFTSTDIDTGEVVHTLRVDAVGLPPDESFFIG